MRVRVGDVSLYFDVVGAGLVPEGPTMRERPVVLCLHGGPGMDHTTLKHYLVPLQDVAQLIFLDQRGNGRSDASTPERWNLETWVADVRGFCEALGAGAADHPGPVIWRDRCAGRGDSLSRAAREVGGFKQHCPIPA